MILLIPIPFSIIACYTDIKTRKIKNYITYPLILSGIFLNSFINSFEGFKGSLLGIFIVVLITSLVPVFRLGGGDLKLAMAYGAFLKDDNILMFLDIFIIFTVLGNFIFFIRNRGLKCFFSELLYEIKTFGIYKTHLDKLPGAPFLVGAYILTILISYL